MDREIKGVEGVVVRKSTEDNRHRKKNHAVGGRMTDE